MRAPYRAQMELASRQLRAKFDTARAVLDKMALSGISPNIGGALSNELAALEMKFALSMGHLYIQAADGETERAAAAAEFARTLASEDFSGEVNRIVGRTEATLIAAGVPLRDRSEKSRAAPARRCASRITAPKTKALPKLSPALTSDLQRLLDRYPREDSDGRSPSLADGSYQRVDYGVCPVCGGGMAVDAGRSALRCADPSCGVVRTLVGIVFDDSQFYNQEGQKAKSGTFNPNRHFHTWWVHILAREPEEEIGDKDDPDNQYGEMLILNLANIVRRDGLILRLLTVDNVRAMLREVRRTDLNKNVPLILKKLTGIGPPQLSEAIAVRTENLFTKAIEASDALEMSHRTDTIDYKFAALCGSDPNAARVNRNYYPYYISRVLEAILPENDYESRRVFYYIYVQSKETVEADDANWERICESLGEEEIKYRPTDRTLGLRYGPG